MVLNLDGKVVRKKVAYWLPSSDEEEEEEREEVEERREEERDPPESREYRCETHKLSVYGSKSVR